MTKVQAALSSWDRALLDAELIWRHIMYPSVVAEVPIIEIETDCLIVDSLDELTKIDGVGATSAFERVYSLCDGKHSFSDITEKSGLSSASAVAILDALLEARAIEEASDPYETDLGTRELAFVARTARRTGWFRSTHEALRSLAQMTVTIFASSELKDQLVPRLVELGLPYTPFDGCASAAAGSILIICEHSHAVDCISALKRAGVANFTIITASAGVSSFTLGPSIRETATIAYARAAMSSGFPGSDDGIYDSASLLLDLLAQALFLIAARLADIPLHRRRFVTAWKNGGISQECYLVGDFGDYPVAQASARELGITGPADLDRLIAATEMPPSAEIAPANHLIHYESKNLKLAKSFPQQINARFAVRLPEISVGRLTDGIYALERLGAFLFLSGGVHKDGEVYRRVAPSGGNIGAVELYLRVRRMPGLAAGVYRYHAFTHSLEQVDNIADCDLSGPDEDFDLVLVGNVNKVEGKYGPKAYQIIRYEAGVLRTFISRAAFACELTTSNFPYFDKPQLIRELRLPCTTTSIDIYGVISVKGGSHDIADCVILNDVALELKARKAYREFQHGGVDHDALLKIFDRAALSLAGLLEEWGGPLSAGLILIEKKFGAMMKTEVYRSDKSSPSPILINSLSGHQRAQNLFNQRLLGLAPAAIVAVLDEMPSDYLYDPSAFSELLQIMGATIASIWMDVVQAGFVGTAAGGVLRHDFDLLMPPHHNSPIPFLSVCFGNPPVRP